MSSRSQINRRRFLKRAGAVTAAVSMPVVVPRSVLGAAEQPAPSERIAVGMIGLGRQAYYKNMKQFLAMSDVRLVAVCDVDAWRLENAKRAVEAAYAKSKPSGNYSGCRACVEFEEVIGSKDIDAVMISTPDHWHAPMAVAAMKAGKDVSLEKPITRTIAQGRQLSDLSKKLGRVFRVDSELRSNRTAHRAATLVRNGLVGRIKNVVVGVPQSDVPCPPQPEMPVPKGFDYERWQGPAPRAPYTQKRCHPPRSYGRPGWMRHLYYCDGMVTNWGTHLNDLAMWSTDLERTGPVEIEGTGKYPPPESFWNVLLEFDVRYRFAGGLTWTYKTESPFFRIEGSKGWIQSGFSKTTAHPASILDARIGPRGVKFRFKSDKQDFIDSVKTREETLEPAEVGHRVTSLCHLAHIAVHTRQKLQWDPQKERFVGNDAANRYVDRPILEPSYA